MPKCFSYQRYYDSEVNCDFLAVPLSAQYGIGGGVGILDCNAHTYKYDPSFPTDAISAMSSDSAVLEEEEVEDALNTAWLSTFHRQTSMRWADISETDDDTASTRGPDVFESESEDDNVDMRPAVFTSVDTASNVEVRSKPAGLPLHPIVMPLHSACQSDDSDADICPGHHVIQVLPVEDIGTEDAEAKAFLALELLWFNTRDPKERERLCQKVLNAEVAYAFSRGIYRKILQGKQTLLGKTKAKTRNRHQTRRRQQRCIGLPQEGRAEMRNKYKKNPRCRIDHESHEVVCWGNFRRENAHLPLDEMMDKWKQNPRKRRGMQSRRFHGVELPWDEATSRFGAHYDATALYQWFLRLPYW